MSISEANDLSLIVGISVTLAFLVTVVISSLMVALAVARRWSKHVPQLPPTEHIYDIPNAMCETKLSTMNETTESGLKESPVYLTII